MQGDVLADMARQQIQVDHAVEGGQDDLVHEVPQVAIRQVQRDCRRLLPRLAAVCA